MRMISKCSACFRTNLVTFDLHLGYRALCIMCTCGQELLLLPLSGSLKFFARYQAGVSNELCLQTLLSSIS